MDLRTILHSGCRTTAALLAMMGTLGGTALLSRELTVCLDVQANIDPATVMVFGEELKAIAGSSGFSLRLLDQPAVCQDIRLTIKSMAMTEISALGATRVRDGRILPEIEIYSKSIAALMRSTLPGPIGRGMARVAAHEITHYLLQSTAHSEDLMAEYYTAAHLLVKNNRSFRIPLVASARQRNPIRW